MKSCDSWTAEAQQTLKNEMLSTNVVIILKSLSENELRGKTLLVTRCVDRNYKCASKSFDLIQLSSIKTL